MKKCLKKLADWIATAFVIVAVGLFIFFIITYKVKKFLFFMNQ